MRDKFVVEGEAVGKPVDFAEENKVPVSPNDTDHPITICLVGDFSGDLDEGYKNTSYHLARGLEEHNTVIRLNVKRVRAVEPWRSLLRLRPQLIHIIAQPTHQSLMFTRLLGLAWPQARTVISSLRPEAYFIGGKVSQIQRRLIHLTRPNLVLVQSHEARGLLEQLGCSVAQLPNGVDLERFRPVTGERRRQLRTQYGLDPGRPVVLHVGHLQATRNLMALSPLPRAGVQVVIAGSLYMGTDHSLIARLERAGVRVFKGYQARVEELYMLADCYVFPPQPGDSLSMPLSVLEAMACNLRVVTARFSGLEYAFEEGHGLRFIDSTDAFLPYVQEMLVSPMPATRPMVSAYSWQSVINRLQRHYQELLDG
jgi:glycosyltransferase involved in cell wall biosynthesis